MSNHSPRSLLPRQQTEFPARGLLPEETLHHRREATFLALAALFLVSSAALVLLGAGRAIDLSALVARVSPDLALPAALLPIGALAFAASFVASSLVCHLFGSRRANALVLIGAISALALAGLIRVADVIDGGDAFGGALAFAAAAIIGHATNLFVFERLRGRGVFLPLVAAAIVANVIGWSAFAAVLHLGAGYVLAPMPEETIVALGVGSATWSIALVLVLAIPAALAARALAVALRVGRDLFAGRLPQAVIVEEDEVVVPARPRAHRGSLQPYSSAEMRFFSDGDALGD